MENSIKKFKNSPVTPELLSRIAESLFLDSPLKSRLIQKYRPYICPFDELIDFVPHESSIMDVGCGGGLFLCLLAGIERIRKGYGFDSSRQAIEEAQSMTVLAKKYGYGADLKFEMRSATSEWPNSTFDVVSIIDVMHHISPSAQCSVIEKAAAHVKPGGRLIYKDMCRRPLWRALANRLHDLMLAREWIFYAATSDVNKWATNNALKLLHSSRINLLWYGHELLVFEKPLHDC